MNQQVEEFTTDNGKTAEEYAVVKNNESAKDENTNIDQKSINDDVESKKSKNVHESLLITEKEKSENVDENIEKTNDINENATEDAKNTDEKIKAKLERRKSREERKKRKQRRQEKKEKKEESAAEEQNEVDKTAEEVDESKSSGEPAPANKQETSTTKQDTLDGSTPEPPLVEKQISEEEISEQAKQKLAIEEAALAHREKEAEAFQKLIDENVKLESEVQKLQKKIENLEYQENLISLDLDAEKVKTLSQADQIKALEHDLKMQEIIRERKGSACSSEVREKAQKADGYSVQATILASRLKDGQETEAYLRHQVYEVNEIKEEQETKIKDLQLRLTRMTKDCEEKDKRIYALNTELKEIGEMVVQLEKYLDNERVQKIHDERDAGRTKERVTRTDTNMVGDSSPSKSSVCSIQ